MTKTRLTVLATGGTIAGKAGSALRHDYRPGQIGIEEFLTQVTALGLEAEFSGSQLANIGSEDISEDIWREIHASAEQAITDPECDGIIITHGTDTVEETAFLLDQTLPTIKPVVMVGAMRPADAVGSDGLRNFANAVHIAGDADAAGRGVLVTMGDQVFAARDVYKARTDSSDAFSGYPRGAIGLARPGQLEWFGAPWRAGEGARFAFPGAFPEVPIAYLHAAMSAQTLLRQVSEATRGLVIAGYGEGTMPGPVREALKELNAREIVTVRASRVAEALVDRSPLDEANGTIAARALNPQKARILLQLLLASGESDPAAIQRAFEKR